VRWQAGAAWFLEHLLDGDPASNALGWQWVAGSFSHKPYIFNRANLERYAGDRHCRRCPRAGAGCPFEASYEALQERLFAAGPGRETKRNGDGRDAGAAEMPPASDDGNLPQDTDDAATGPPTAGREPPRRPVVWVHGEALGPANPALRAAPDRPAVFVFDTELIGGGTATTAPAAGPDQAPRPLSRKRLGFLAECLQELPVTVRRGDVAEQVIAFAAEHGADGVVTSRAVDPRFERLRRRIAGRLPVVVLEPEPFVELEDSAERPLDLRRFSRYWRRAAPKLWAMAP
jgi:deoxyribodipyrimidine photo-lyase